MITFLSDFGLQDEWVAACKGVILNLAPEAAIVDISHQIPAYDILKGSLVLAGAAPFFPSNTVHLAVVDPEVGTDRLPLALESKRGDLLVGPDNGLLLPAVERLGGLELAVAISNTDFMRQPVSPTFNARDIFAQAAAHLANGVSPGQLGPEIDPSALAQSAIPEPAVEQGVIVGQVIDIDRFGTVRLNVTRVEIGQALNVPTGGVVCLGIGSSKIELPYRRTFADAKEGEALLLIDSSGWLSLAVNRGSAVSEFGVKVGDEARLTKERP